MGQRVWVQGSGYWDGRGGLLLRYWDGQGGLLLRYRDREPTQELCLHQIGRRSNRGFMHSAESNAILHPTLLSILQLVNNIFSSDNEYRTTVAAFPPICPRDSFIR